MGKTKIEWATDVWNPVTGCTKISEGCANCYADRMATRLRGRCGYPKVKPFSITVHFERLNLPCSWRTPRRIFVNSMGDLFHEDVHSEALHSVLDVITKCPWHTFLILTKRPERMLDFFLGSSGAGANVEPLSNLWLGVTAENQAQADRRIPFLLSVPAAVRFVSVEPMLRPVTISFSYEQGPPGATWTVPGPHRGINWVIAGPETGPGARRFELSWARDLAEQCSGAGVPFFYKGKNPPPDLKRFELPDETIATNARLEKN